MLVNQAKTVTLFDTSLSHLRFSRVTTKNITVDNILRVCGEKSTTDCPVSTTTTMQVSLEHWNVTNTFVAQRLFLISSAALNVSDFAVSTSDSFGPKPSAYLSSRCRRKYSL